MGYNGLVEGFLMVSDVSVGIIPKMKMNVTVHSPLFRGVFPHILCISYHKGDKALLGGFLVIWRSVLMVTE